MGRGCCVLRTARRSVPTRLRSAGILRRAALMDLLHQVELSGLLDRALAEDIGLGDVTTAATVQPDARGRARITVKEDEIVFCGGPLIAPIMARCGAQARIGKLAAEGAV